MQGMEFMIKRAEYRKESEAHLFEKTLEWAKEDNEEIIIDIIERAFADDSAENWLTIHPTSSYTGLTGHYMEIVAEEKELNGNERRLLNKKLNEYSKRLLG